MALKQPTTLDEQLALLKQRGCVVEDDSYALRMLADINYYRLSAYFLPFRDGDKYIPGTSFSTIIDIYEFDRRLRTLLLALMEGLETKLRTRIAYLHAHRYGALGYLDGRNFNSQGYQCFGCCIICNEC
jgi:abortive infection bacteriophage resistance protein